MRSEWFARILVIFLILAAVLIPAVTWLQNSQGILMHARMAETGGWTPENLTVEAGQPVHLRLTSDDVTHSFAIGQSDQPPVDVLPGEITELTLVFDQPGKYTFYCTRWCSLNHWRMRGVIEVTTPAGQPGTPEPVEPPLYVQLGLDIDATHAADVLPAQRPSAPRGAAFSAVIPPEYQSRDIYLTYTPVQLWHALRQLPALQALSDMDLWDAVAWVWRSSITTGQIAAGAQLFATNCAACHGEQGGGNGVFAEELANPAMYHDGPMAAGEMTTRPVDFTSAEAMLAASSAHLQGKILRGGMGTGMPYWGPILTEDQTWALVAYLWNFQFDMEEP